MRLSKNLVETLLARVEELEKSLKAEHEQAIFYAKGLDYYRGVLVTIGEAIGREAYIAEDGSVQQDVLIAKLPELVKELVLTIEKGYDR